jgi:transitional endoplasmic reticulum ATPase|tara:strand:- start:4 stop:714 length:711 start_codon:yes stop_codon:yes gene_type:complete
MDSLAKARGNGSDSGVGDRVVNQLLTEMDGVGARKDLFVIGASNMITLMDPAVMRNGRLDQLVYIPMPDLEARKAIFRANLRKTPIADNVNTDLLAEHTEGYSGADISGICQTAVKLVVRKRLHDVKEALKKIPLDAKEARKKATMEINKTPLLITHECFEIAKNQSKASISHAEHQKYLAQRSKMSEQSASGSGSMGMSQDDQNLIGKFVKITAGSANQVELENLYDDSDSDDED